MKSQQHRWKTWLNQVVRHQGGASTVEWIGLIAIALVALGVSAFALGQNGNVVGGSFARQFECALRVVGIEGVTCDQLDEAEARGINVPQQTIDPPPSLFADEGECQLGESAIGDDGYLRQTKTCSRVSPDNPKAVETCTATSTGQDLWEGEAPPPEYSCETTQVVPEPLEGYECTETTSTTADGDQQFDQDCWRSVPDNPSMLEECHNSTVVNAQSISIDPSWDCETTQILPEPPEGYECTDSIDGDQATRTCEKREENGDETTITTCTYTTTIQPDAPTSDWNCREVIEREEEECKLEWKFWETIENCGKKLVRETNEHVIEPAVEWVDDNVVQPLVVGAQIFWGSVEEVGEGVKALLTGELEALIGIVEGIIEFFKNPSRDALDKILDSACQSITLQFIPGVGDALGILCGLKDTIKSSIDGDIAGAVIAALSLAIEALFAFVPGMGDLVGGLMDQVAPIIKKLFKSSDEVADTGTDVARHSDEAADGVDGPPSGDADEAPDSDVCITYRGKVRGLAMPEACAPEVGEPTPKRQRTECTDACQQTVQKHDKSIKKANELQGQLSKDPTDKTIGTVMVDGEPVDITSGHTIKPDGDTKSVEDKLARRALEFGDEFEPPMTFRGTGANDGDVAGIAQAGHVEKKSYMDARESTPPGEPIVMGISKGMCDQCIGFMMRAAKKDGREVIVSDPHVTRIFKSDGSVIMIKGDNKVNYPPPKELTEQAWNDRAKEISKGHDPNTGKPFPGFDRVGPHEAPTRRSTRSRSNP